LSYDADGKMSASNGAVYTRDPFGQRVLKGYSGAATEYYYFGGQLLATRDPSSSQWTDYIYAGGRLIAEAPSGTTDTVFYRIGDHLDSLAEKTDSTGDLLGTNDISPYGELISNAVSDRLLFTQHERDTENGSDAALYRQYASAQGRWLSADPYNGSYNLADPQSLNRYAYLSGRPLISVDSLGLDDDGCGDDDGSGGCDGPILGTIFGGGGEQSHHGPPNTSATSYGSPYGTGVFPPYVTQQSSDPGSLGESLGIPLSIPQGVWGIAPALGLPPDSCEFGACGIGPMGAYPGAYSAVPYINLQSWQQLLAHFYPWYWFNKGGSNIVPGTHHCGPGGWGSTNGPVDAACYQHDTCYDNVRIGALNILFGSVPASAKAGQATCDQQLCQTISNNTSYTPDQMAQQFWVSGFFNCK
jgi:RHS repeat-associated protein